MKNLITKPNITSLNLVLLGFFLITLIAVAVPYLKNEPGLSLSPSEERPARQPPAPPQPEETYVCPRHPAQRSTSPGKCPECGADLQTVKKYAAIVDRDLFNAHLIPPPEPPLIRVEPLRWELVGVTTIQGRLVASIRDRSSPQRGSVYKTYLVGEGEEVEGFFGVKILSISADPPSVKYERLGIGVEELTMGTPTATTSGPGKDPWAGIIYSMVSGYSYGVKLGDLRARIASLEAYRGSFGLQPNMVGTRMDGLKVTSLPRDNFLYAAGFRAGDIIKSINSSPITDEKQALNLLRIAGRRPTLNVEIVRGRATRKLIYTLRK